MVKFSWTRSTIFPSIPLITINSVLFINKMSSNPSPFQSTENLFLEVDVFIGTTSEYKRVVTHFSVPLLIIP